MPYLRSPKHQRFTLPNTRTTKRCSLGCQTTRNKRNNRSIQRRILTPSQDSQSNRTNLSPLWHTVPTRRQNRSRPPSASNNGHRHQPTRASPRSLQPTPRQQSPQLGDQTRTELPPFYPRGVFFCLSEDDQDPDRQENSAPAAETLQLLLGWSYAYSPETCRIKNLAR